MCFLKLLEIPRIALSLSVSHDTVAYLVILIEEHHTMFTKQYPNESILPILHYPRQIISHGPLVRAWAIRFEGKLKYFKEIAQLSNFKNITLTLAKRHQRWLAYYLHSGNLFTFELTRGPILSSSTQKRQYDK